MILTNLSPIQEQAVDIISIILAIIVIIAFLSMCVYWALQEIKTQSIRKDFINKLNEHDKALIKDYENLKWTPRKKNKE